MKHHLLVVFRDGWPTHDLSLLSQRKAFLYGSHWYGILVCGVCLLTRFRLTEYICSFVSATGSCGCIEILVYLMSLLLLLEVFFKVCLRWIPEVRWCFKMLLYIEFVTSLQKFRHYWILWLVAIIYRLTFIQHFRCWATFLHLCCSTLRWIRIGWLECLLSIYCLIQTLWYQVSVKRRELCAIVLWYLRHYYLQFDLLA